ncbi:MAG: hypothetical protein MI802_04955 [Desulfobacterales bacterium]|nr:hypothetical protein [Desulfobacterales bacterium]
MISKLDVVITIRFTDNTEIQKSYSLDALELLGLLQQALPGIKPPAGTGTLSSPWQPKTPAEWFYCAKVSGIAHRQMVGPGRSGLPSDSRRLVSASRTSFKGSGEDRKAWLRIGGRRVRILASNLYASDCGLDSVRLRRGREPALVYRNASYPKIWEKICEQAVNQSTRDRVLTSGLRKVLKGQRGRIRPDILPLLANVLFVSEAARNHTAFHAALMILDLIECSIKKPLVMNGLPTKKVNWKWALWQPEGQISCPDCQTVPGKVVCPDCNGTRRYPVGRCRTFNGKRGTARKPCRNSGCRNGRHTVRCRRCVAGRIECPRCKGKATVRATEFVPAGRTGDTAEGGVAHLQGGLLPMSHSGSAYGSAYDLGKMGAYYGVWKSSRTPSKFTPLHILTIVRRKEATILATWLAVALKSWAARLNRNTELKKSGIKSITMNTSPKATDFTANETDGESVYEALLKLAELETYDLDDWIDRWTATARDLSSFSSGAVQLRGRMTSGGVSYDLLEKGRVELKAYQLELVDALLPVGILELLQHRVSSFDYQLL